MSVDQKTPEQILAEKTAADAAAAAAATKAAEDAAVAAAAKAEADAKKTPEQIAAENEANKFRRLHEKAEADRLKLEAELKKRTDAELSETERQKQALDEAIAERDKLRHENLRQKVASEANLPADLAEFLTATDEDGLRAQAETLAAKLASPDASGGENRPPARAGTQTQPARGQQPSVDEKIAEAYKSGNTMEGIRLKRERAGLGSQ